MSNKSNLLIALGASVVIIAGFLGVVTNIKASHQQSIKKRTFDNEQSKGCFKELSQTQREKFGDVVDFIVDKGLNGSAIDFAHDHGIAILPNLNLGEHFVVAAIGPEKGEIYVDPEESPDVTAKAVSDVINHISYMYNRAIKPSGLVTLVHDGRGARLLHKREFQGVKPCAVEGATESTLPTLIPGT